MWRIFDTIFHLETVCPRIYGACETVQNNLREKKLATFSTNKLERFRNVVSDLAQTWKTVTKLNVGNKQQVTQMYTSHATQLVIHLTVWLQPYSLWLGFFMPSFLITVENRQTHERG